MEDNGLLRYYRQKHARQNGKLDLSAYPFRFRMEYQEGYGSIRATYDNNQKYFHKFVDKKEVDAEVLLSQIFAKAGFKTAIYTPLNPNGVISQTVEAPNRQVAKDFFVEKMKQDKHIFGDYEQKCIREGSAPVLYKYFSQYKNHFEPSCATDYLRMRLFDISTNNTDRNFSNYYIQKNEEGKAEDIILIDYGASGNPYKPPNFYSHLNGSYVDNKENIIDFMKSDQTVLGYVNPKEVAEEIGSIDVVETAKDIKDTINYEVDSAFVDKIAKSMEDTAEALIK